MFTEGWRWKKSLFAAPGTAVSCHTCQREREKEGGKREE